MDQNHAVMDDRLPFMLLHADPYLASCQCCTRKPCKHETKWRAEGEWKRELAEALTTDDVTWLLHHHWDGELR